MGLPALARAKAFVSRTSSRFAMSAGCRATKLASHVQSPHSGHKWRRYRGLHLCRWSLRMRIPWAVGPPEAEEAVLAADDGKRA
jgi:hypothetical protein